MSKASRHTRRYLLGAVALMVCFLTACASSNNPQDVLRPAGSVARTENSLWKGVFPIAVFVFI
ncbi:MAG: hypothetical protein ACJ786_10840, partial [Catenulispora sp.]